VPQATMLPRAPNNIGSTDENKYKKNHCTAFKNYKKKIQGFLHPAQANLGYFLVWFQSLQLSSTQSESSLVLFPLAPKSHVF
jgi:hypothetical protein